MVWTDELVGAVTLISIVCDVGAGLCVGDTGVYGLLDLGQETGAGGIDVSNLHGLVADGVCGECDAGDGSLNGLSEKIEGEEDNLAGKCSYCSNLLTGSDN